MSIDTETSSYQRSALEFKSSSFSVPVLVISCTELKQINAFLDEKIAQAPEFFKNSPLLIDLHEINQRNQPIDFSGLITLLHSKKLIPIGVSGTNADQNNLAIELKIPIHTLKSTHSAHSPTTQAQQAPTPIQETVVKEADPAPVVENKLITQPIRSGQRVYTKGDLTILSHVSAGAEIMAEGSIHIYGALRGRALAGVQGNPDSRIFCSSLNAELISIAGHYKTSEELDKIEHNSPVQIYLQDQALIINTL